MNKIDCSAENAPKFVEWIRSRGGVALWRSANLSNPGATWSAPADVTRPTWQAEEKPWFIVTDPDEIEVYIPLEVSRLKIATKVRGFTVHLTKPSTMRLHKALVKAGNDSFYAFNGDEAVIYTRSEVKSLSKWMKDQESAS